MSELPNENFSNAFGDNIRDAFNKAKRDRDALLEKMKKATGDAKDKLKKAIEKEDARLKRMKNEGGIFTAFNQITQKFNPAAAVPRGAGLALVRLNFMGFARKWYPALLTTEELKAKNYDLENAAVVKKLWEKNVKFFWENLGGDISALKKATLQGFNKPVFKTKKVKAAKRQEQGSSADGGLSPFNKWANEYDFSVADANFNQNFTKEHYNEIDPSVLAALIAAGGAIVIGALNTIGKKGGAKDNPFDANSPEFKKAMEDAIPDSPPLTAQDAETLKAIEMAALEDRKKHGLDPGTYEAEFNAIENKYSKFLGMPKPIGITVAIVGTLLLAFGGYKLYKHFKK